MDKIIDCKNLISQVNLIIEKYNEIAKHTGEKFNIFSILKLERREVKTHSAFIAELLNINGSHGLKEIPLKIFIEVVIKKIQRENPYIDSNAIDKFQLDFKNSIAIKEEYHGKVNDDYSEGGRIDIVIKDNTKKAIVIENKIDASEQTKQLERYNFAYPNCPILFLTLYENQPISAGDLILNQDIFTISYKNEITLWIEKCIKESSNLPILRESLKQYNYLIKKITNQSLNVNMSQEIINIMKQNIQSSFEISNNIETLKKSIIKDFIYKLNYVLKNDELEMIEYDFVSFGNKDSELNFNLKSQDLVISIYIEENQFGSTYIGIGNLNNTIIDELKKKLTNDSSKLDLGPNITNDIWYLYFEYTKLQKTNLSDFEFYEGLQNQDKINEIAQDLIRLKEYVLENS